MAVALGLGSEQGKQQLDVWKMEIHLINGKYLKKKKTLLVILFQRQIMHQMDLDVEVKNWENRMLVSSIGCYHELIGIGCLQKAL